jgi:hypothetical protein
VIDDTDKERAETQRQALMREEAHYAAIKRVFGTADGIDVLEWLLTDLCGYWRSRLDSERELGKFELGRFVFNHVCMADMNIAHSLLDRRRKSAESIRNAERQRIEKQAKEQ